MCDHVPDAKVKIRAACCGSWVVCWKCHNESADHPFKFDTVLVMQCTQCKGIFKKDLAMFASKDCSCPFCDVAYVEAGGDKEEGVVATASSAEQKT